MVRDLEAHGLEARGNVGAAGGSWATAKVERKKKAAASDAELQH